VLSADEKASIDFGQPPSAWPPFASIISQLQSQYSAVLGVSLRVGEVTQSIPWDVLKLQEMYSDPSKEPDAEHLCLALLIEEGFLLNLVTTNWDPLIEKAHTACCNGRTSTLDVVACNEELSRQGSGRAPRLLKIHGCAKKAVGDSLRYLPFMVATKHQIAMWTGREPIRDATRALLREGPALFIGLSGQDFNLQMLFVDVRSAGDPPFPPSPVRVAFCAAELSEDHRAILQNVYGDTTFNANADIITKEAAVPLFAKPLLGTLYALGLKEKIACLLKVAESELESFHLEMALAFLDKVEKRMCRHYDAVSETDERWRSLSRELSRSVTRLLSLYRSQQLPPHPEKYEPLSPFNLAEIGDTSVHRVGQLHWLFVMLSCLLEGEERGFWKLELPFDRDASVGQVIVWQDEEPCRIFLLDRPSRRAHLERAILYPNPASSPFVLMYPSERVPAGPTRFPTRVLPGAADPDEVVEISLQDLVTGTTTQDELLDALRTELLTARRDW
jgi:hypothetical protein